MSANSISSRRLFIKTSATVAASLGTFSVPASSSFGVDDVAGSKSLNRVDSEAAFRDKSVGEWIAQLKDEDDAARSSAAWKPLGRDRSRRKVGGSGGWLNR